MRRSSRPLIAIGRFARVLIALGVALPGLSSCRENGGSHHHDDDDHHVWGSAEVEVDWSAVEAEFELELTQPR